MQRLEVSGAVRPLKWPLGVKWLKSYFLQLRKTKKDLMEFRGPKRGIFRGYYILVCNLM
jgi:hypothetical protein